MEMVQEEEKMILEAFQEVKNKYLSNNPQGNVSLIEKAFNLANQAHRGMRRRSGEPYILHPISVARIVSEEIGLGATSIASSLLHDVVEDTDYTLEDIENLFGHRVASVVDGLTKLEGAFDKGTTQQAENFRKLLLTMADDVRVILIKIADRLHNMRTLEAMPNRKKYKISGETLFFYAPLAHRLGLFTIKTELEDLAFKYEHPRIYQEIAQKIKGSQEERGRFFESFAAPIRFKLNSLDFDFDVKGRVKSVYSIYKKMMAKNIPFEEIYDIMAIRIVFEPRPYFDEKLQCWNIYSAITDVYAPKPERIRDWVSTPKANGYEALHVTVMGPEGHWVEVQIRSRRMDDIAEKGYAAHWKYKNGSQRESELDKWLKNVREMLENPENNTLEFLDDFKLNLFASEIMLFTPKGEIKSLPVNATTLDFAFDIHTELGYKCIGAKVNHKLVPLSYQLKSGDQVEIITSAKQKPQEEWLDFVTTARAKSKIKIAFKKERKTFIRKGETLLEENLHTLKLTTNSRILKKLFDHFNISNKDELLYKIGKGNIPLDNLSKILKQKSKNKWIRYWRLQFGKNQEKETISSESIIDKKKPLVITDDLSQNHFSRGECCNPIPGDDVIGYLDENDAIILHKRDCPIALKLMSNYGNKILDAQWTSHKLFSFLVIIKINGLDRLGMVSNITKIISEDQAVNMRSVHFESHDGIFEGIIYLYVHDAEDINNLIVKIMKTKGVNAVTRVNNPELNK